MGFIQQISPSIMLPSSHHPFWLSSPPPQQLYSTSPLQFQLPAFKLNHLESVFYSSLLRPPTDLASHRILSKVDSQNILSLKVVVFTRTNALKEESATVGVDERDFNQEIHVLRNLHLYSQNEAPTTTCFSAAKLAMVGIFAGLAVLAGNTDAAYARTGDSSPLFPIEPLNCSSTKLEQDSHASLVGKQGSDTVGKKSPLSTSSCFEKNSSLDKNRLGKYWQRATRYAMRAARSHANLTAKRLAERDLRHSLPLPRQQIVRELTGESLGINYEQVIQGHKDTQQKREMFTGDAWMGMMRLQKYNDLLDSIKEKENLCPECTRNRRLLEQVWQTVSNEYFDQYGRFSQAEWSGELYQTLSGTGGLLQSKAETYKAAKEMVARLGDRYSSFLTPEEYRLALRRPIPSELKYLAYQYTGVGMEIGKRCPNGGLTIVAPFAGSPAEEAGIIGGERLLSIDGISVDLLTKDEAVTLLRGPIGSLVELELVGVGPDATVRNLLLERRALPLPPLKMQMVDAGNGHLVAYLRLHYFTHDGTKRMASAIREGEAFGVDGYILDLRNNPGGVFEEAIAMAALWLDCKDCGIAETVRSNVADIDDFVYRAGNLPQEIFLRHPGVLTHAPLVTISNRNSASASEVLIGALHDNQRTLVLGERTFGKGVVQYYFPMDDGSGLKVTVAKYLTPRRYDISKQGGLLPDEVCGDYPHAGEMSDQCINEALKRLQSIVDVEQKEERRTGVSVPAPMPYRWLPLGERRLWSRGSY